MAETTQTGRTPSALAAGGAAALGASLAIALSAPPLTRPFGPALLFAVVAPGLAGFLMTLALSPWMRGARARAALGGVIGALPWLAITASSMARHPSAAAGGAALTIAVGFLLAERRPWLAAIPWLLAAVAPALRPEPPGLSGKRSVVVVGFDGATWDEIDPMSEDGSLPHFRRLREGAATGILKSEEIMASPRVWTTIASGVPPETHGILSFGFNRSRLRAGRVWDEAMARGRRAGVVGWLVTSPPDPGLDFSFPGWITTLREAVPSQASFAIDLEHVLRDEDARARWKNIVSPRGISRVLNALAVSSADNAWEMLGDTARLGFTNPGPGELYWRTKLLVARLKTDLFLELVARYRPDLGALVTYPTDSLAHRFWQFHQPELVPHVSEEALALHGNVVRNAYRTADETLGKILERIDLERTTLLVVSDHGMVGVPLEERILLINGPLLVELLGMEDELESAKSVHNLALSPKQDGEAAEAALVRALDLLSSATLVGREEAAFRVVRPVINPSTLVLRLSHAVLPWEQRIRIADRETTVRDLCYRDLFSSDHTQRGLLAIAGPGVKPGGRVDAELEDVAPTVLWRLGLSVPQLPGRVIRGAFEDGWLTANEPHFRDGPMPPPPSIGEVTEDEDVVLERLRELGYVR